MSLVDYPGVLLLLKFKSVTYKTTVGSGRAGGVGSSGSVARVATFPSSRSSDRSGCLHASILRHDERHRHRSYKDRRAVRRHDDRSGYPPVKQPQQLPFAGQNIYTDGRHDLGPASSRRAQLRRLDSARVHDDASSWGVATTAPYGHDGRSTTSPRSSAARRARRKPRDAAREAAGRSPGLHARVPGHRLQSLSRPMTCRNSTTTRPSSQYGHGSIRRWSSSTIRADPRSSAALRRWRAEAAMSEVEPSPPALMAGACLFRLGGAPASRALRRRRRRGRTCRPAHDTGSTCSPFVASVRSTVSGSGSRERRAVCWSVVVISHCAGLHQLQHDVTDRQRVDVVFVVGIEAVDDDVRTESVHRELREGVPASLAFKSSSRSPDHQQADSCRCRGRWSRRLFPQSGFHRRGRNVEPHEPTMTEVRGQRVGGGVATVVTARAPHDDIANGPRSSGTPARSPGTCSCIRPFTASVATSASQQVTLRDEATARVDDHPFAPPRTPRTASPSGVTSAPAASPRQLATG